MILTERLDRQCLALTIGMVVSHAVAGDENSQMPALPDAEAMREEFKAALRDPIRPPVAETAKERERRELLSALGLRRR